MLRSLSLKLYVGLAVAILLVVIVGYVSIASLNNQERQSETVKHSGEVISVLRDIQYDIMKIRGGRRAFWASGEPRFMDAFGKGSSVVPNKVDHLEELVGDNWVQLKNVRRLDSLLTVMFRFWVNDGKLSPGTPKEAFTKIILREEDILNEVSKQFELIKTQEEQLLLRRENNVSQSNRQTKTILIFGISILMAVVLLLVNSVIQTLKSRYKAGLRLKEGLAEMEKTTKLAQEKNWVLEGVSYINNRLQIVDSTLMLADRMINSMVQYLELPAGAIYYTDEKKTKLVSVASVGASAASQKEFAIGDGIVGSAALVKTPTIIKHIPAAYWKVESYLGQITGKGEIMCVPLWVNGELKGVIELGCFESFTDLQKSLIESIIDILSVAINSHQSRERIDMLLEELQDQQNVLLEQQEELRQTNMELSRQAEELQVSEEELKTQEEELKQINIELKQRNDVIEGARHTLSIKAKELTEISQYKSEFLANMSHELRTPLNSVLILAKLLSDNTSNNLTEKQVEYANIIHRSGKDLLQLINDILDLSKIEAGKLDLLIEEVRVADIENDLKQMLTIVATDKGINFTIEAGADVPVMIRTDRLRLEQVIKNLLSNAFKFTPAGGQVMLSFKRTQQFNHDLLAISVSDTGIGISEEKQQMIFEAFQQADGSTNRKYGGTGLGLSISKELVRLLKGKIEVFSEEGKGSTFTIFLPETVNVAISGKNNLKNAGNVANSNPGELVEQDKVEDDRNNLLPGDKLMLIIEDDLDFALIVRDFAREKGYKTVIALQGDEGLHYARRYRPAAIILDIQLPVMDGWALLKQFRADDTLKNIPVHIISAFDDNRLKHAGVLAYLKKPVEKNALEKAFSLIDAHIQPDGKKVLIISNMPFNEKELQRLCDEKNYKVAFEQFTNVDEAIEALRHDGYGCVIINIGDAVGITQVQQVREQLSNRGIPMIIFLDEDISQQDELEMKKMASVIIRNSLTANTRLIDELELFLYKMERTEKKRGEMNYSHEPVDDISLVDKKILLVDDDMRNVFALSAALEASRMKVVIGSDGKDALSQLERHKDIDLVLMDIMMPEMDGYEAMQCIRNDMKLTELPIIALTAKAMAGDRDKCIEAGASDYITKPIDIHKLFSLLSVWLAK